ncbi:MAG TPA: FliG C-terminal domain-containing protein [Myxococcota bacterium]|nr:FliG C-terminal domain-containing protein [Myxococcota bacterium]
MTAVAMETPAELKGTQRAALLLMYLERDIARNLLQQLSTNEVRQVGLAMADVENVTPETIEAIVADFVKDLYRISMLPKTGRQFALRVLPSLVDDSRRERVAGALRRRLSTEFEEYIRAKSPRAVATLLSDEHAQTRAVALLLMGPTNAARVMAFLDEEEQADSALRMARIKSVPGELADDVENALRVSLEDDGADRWSVQGVDRAAQTLGRMGKKANEPLLVKLATADRDLSETLRRRMVVFADLAGLDRRAVQAMLKEIDKQDLLMALKGAELGMQELFLQNLSSRAAADIREELEIMGPTPKSVITKAQENVVEIALRLNEEGLIYLPMGEDDGEE